MQCLQWVGLGAAFAVTLVSSVASAQNTDGAFQIGLTTSVFGYSKSAIEYDDEMEVDISGVTWGLQDQAMLELGYGLGESVVLGGFALLGGASQTAELDDPELEVDDSDASSLIVLLGPKLDLHFGEGAARPFVGVSAAFLTASAERETSESSNTGFQLGARAGVRWFPVPGFSLDPSLGVNYVHASGEIEPDAADSIDVSTSGFSVVLMVGASGWID
jgi:hypothetical protein